MNRNLTRRAGFTLVEVMWASALLALLLAGAFGILLYANEALRTQHAVIDARMEARTLLTNLENQLRLASRDSLQIDEHGGLRYRVPQDIDGDGHVIGADGKAELGPWRTISIDTGDANGDGIDTRQIILTRETQVSVLGNHVATPKSGEPATGLRFELENGGLWITCRTAKRGAPVLERRTFIMPRNP